MNFCHLAKALRILQSWKPIDKNVAHIATSFHCSFSRKPTDITANRKSCQIFSPIFARLCVTSNSFNRATPKYTFHGQHLINLQLLLTPYQLDLTIPVNLARKRKTSGPMRGWRAISLNWHWARAHAHGRVQHVEKARRSRLAIFGRLPKILSSDMCVSVPRIVGDGLRAQTTGWRSALRFVRCVIDGH